MSEEKSKMGRPATGRKVVTTCITMPPTVLALVKESAAAENMSAGAYVTKVLKSHFKEAKPKTINP